MGDNCGTHNRKLGMVYFVNATANILEKDITFYIGGGKISFTI